MELPATWIGELLLLMFGATVFKLSVDLRVEARADRRMTLFRSDVEIHRSPDPRPIPAMECISYYEPADAVQLADALGSDSGLIVVMDADDEWSWWLASQWRAMPPERHAHFPPEAMVVVAGTPRRTARLLRSTQFRPTNLFLAGPDQRVTSTVALRLPLTIAVQNGEMYAAASCLSVGQVIQFCTAEFGHSNIVRDALPGTG